MKYCNNCGRELFDEAVVCPSCGVAQQTPANNNDKGGFGWGLLGCCFPIVGLILFLVWRENKPKSAKSAGIGALVSTIASVVIYLIYFIIVMVAGVGSGAFGF